MSRARSAAPSCVSRFLLQRTRWVRALRCWSLDWFVYWIGGLSVGLLVSLLVGRLFAWLFSWLAGFVTSSQVVGWMGVVLVLFLSGRRLVDLFVYWWLVGWVAGWLGYIDDFLPCILWSVSRWR